MYYHMHIKKSQFIVLSPVILMLPFFAYGYLYAAEHYPVFFFPCALKTYGHLYCPGCGGTHAMAYLLQFHIVQSLLYNPLVLFMAVVLVYYYVKTLVCLIIQHGDARFSIYLGFLWAFLIILVVFFLIRNFLLVNWGIDYMGELVQYWQ